MAWSQKASSAATSLTCERPSSFTSSTGDLWSAIIRAKTSLPCLLLIWPLLASFGRAPQNRRAGPWQRFVAGRGGKKIVEQKVRDGGAIGRLGLRGFLEIIGQRRVRREHARLVRADAVGIDQAHLLRLGQLGHAPHGFLVEALIGAHGLDVGIGKVAIIVRLLLRAHERRFALVVIPAAGLLLDRAAGGDDVDLPRDLVLQRAPYAADAVEIFQFALGAEFLLPFGRTEMFTSQRIWPFSMSASLTAP